MGLPTVGIDNNPLAWWNGMKKILPNLYQAARKYLAVPGTTVAVESLFSEAGLIVTKLRNRLDPKTAGALIFLARNRKLW